MDPLQILLIITGLLIAVGGGILLVRNREGTGGSGLRPYVPLATVAVGFAIAYRSYADFRTLDGQDVTIMFTFVLGILMLLGLQFFVVDRPRGKPYHKPHVDADTGDKKAQDEHLMSDDC